MQGMGGGQDGNCPRIRHNFRGWRPKEVYSDEVIHRSQECKIKMTVESLSMKTVRLLADEVDQFSFHLISSIFQVLMLNNASQPLSFRDLTPDDKDLTMFVITNLILEKTKDGNMVHMALKMKRKFTTELLTTYFPTILLLLITFTTIFFEKDLFGDVIAVNLTIMLVMTTIFTSKIEELPPTSDMKMLDIWLIFCLVVPFLEVILRTAIECLNCSCFNCEPRDANKTKVTGKRNTEKEGGEAEDSRGSSSGMATHVKVAPAEQVLVL